MRRNRAAVSWSANIPSGVVGSSNCVSSSRANDATFSIIDLTSAAPSFNDVIISGPCSERDVVKRLTLSKFLSTKSNVVSARAIVFRASPASALAFSINASTRSKICGTSATARRISALSCSSATTELIFVPSSLIVASAS